MRHSNQIGLLTFCLAAICSCGFGTELTASQEPGSASQNAPVPDNGTIEMSSVDPASRSQTATEPALRTQSVAQQTTEQTTNSVSQSTAAPTVQSPAAATTLRTEPAATAQPPVQETSQSPVGNSPAGSTTGGSAIPSNGSSGPTGSNAPAAAPQPVYTQPNGPAPEKMNRAERRHYKLMQFAAGIDSLVQSHNFRFLPNSMQEMPGGDLQLIYNQMYFIAIFSDHAEVHMPIVRGGTVQYIEILNFDTFDIKNYRLSKSQHGWQLSFNLFTNGNTVYTVDMNVCPLTGETVVNLLTMSNTVRYVGYIQPVDKN